jgi:hypothetical protein
MLRAMPTMSGTPSGLLYQVGASTGGLTPEEAGSSTKLNQFQDQQRVAKTKLSSQTSLHRMESCNSLLPARIYSRRQQAKRLLLERPNKSRDLKDAVKQLPALRTEQGSSMRR